MRLGIFGGTFDPPHLGHFLAASDAFEALQLDRLLFVPAGVQPFKAGQVTAGGAERLEMLRRMVGGDPRFGIDAAEIERNGLSFTLDTVSELAERYPDAERFLLLGEDVVPQFATWREPARIASLVTIAVLARGGVDEASRETLESPHPMMRITTRRVDVSATEIRGRVRAGRSIRGFVTDAVAEFIEAAGLYR